MSGNLLIRKTHRYLGLIIGIQFLGWTVSGIYFSWNDLDNVHGDNIRKSTQSVPAMATLVSPERMITQLKQEQNLSAIHSFQLININGQPTYQVGFYSSEKAGADRSPHY